MRKRILVAFAAMFAAFALSTSAASAEPAQSSSGTGASQGAVLQSDSDTQANCNYKVNRTGGIKIYSKKDHSSTVVGSLANGHRFTATCNNETGGGYNDCPGGANNLWKFVGNGWVKTKCLVRV